MAIAFNAASSTSGGGVESLNFNHSAAGSDRYVLVGLYATNDITAVTVTYGGVSMGAPIATADDGGGGVLRLYGMVAPATGSQAVVASWTNTSFRCAIGAVSYTGVDQSTPRRDTDANVGIDATTVSITLDSQTNDLVVDFAANGSDVINSDASQTRRITLNNFQEAFSSFGASEKTGGASSTTTTWSGSEAYYFVAGTTLIPAATAGSTTVNPLPGSLTMQGREPSVNPFTNVRIAEVLINEAGSPVAGRTGMHLLVWYEGYPFGAPDLSYSDATTGAAGTLSYSLATGPLAYNSPIFYVLTDGNASGSLSGYTCARMVPTYS